MLVSLAAWVYMLVNCYIFGLSFVRLVTLKKPYICKHECSYIIAGICVLTVYAQIFSLFAGVGLWANIIMLAATILLTFFNRKTLIEKLRGFSFKAHPVRNIAVILIVLIMAYGTSHGFMHVDSDLYHAQSIRWIEEYGCVKGLGNIHLRLAYNSASFCLSALFSMSFLGGQSLHVCAGFLAMIVAVLSTGLFRRGEFLSPRLSDFARIAAIYYLVNIYDEMVSPASDYFMVLLVLADVILFLELLEDGNREPEGYALLSLLAVIIVSIKISGALIILLAVYPAVLLVRKKRIGSLFKYLGLGTASLIPFFARNVILSGYLVYPVAQIDIFDLDYKIPYDYAIYDAREIQAYGRGHADVTRFKEGISGWIGDWFATLDSIDKVAFILALSGLLILFFSVIVGLCRKTIKKQPELLVMGTVSACFVFWTVTSPLIRYGCVFLYLTALLNWGFLYGNTLARVDKYILYRVAVLMLLSYKAVALAKESVQWHNNDYLVHQQDYGEYELDEIVVDGETFYYPKTGGLTGYSHFPSIPSDSINFCLKGDSLKDGFKTLE